MVRVEEAHIVLCHPCGTPRGFAMIRLRFDEGRFKNLKRSEKKEVDDHRETLHNLASLLLTNTTIRETQQGSTVCLFFNKQTVDKCGRLMKVPTGFGRLIT
ncbi:hypothetical protein [Massilia terrae]